MKVLLVRVKPHPRSVNLQSFMVCEPLELEYAYSALTAHGHTAEILDMILDKRSFGKVLKSGKYELVCFTGYITHVGVIKRHAREAKKILPECITAVGGVHAEVVPEDFKDDAIDCILWANGVHTLCRIADGFAISDEPGVYRAGCAKPQIVRFEDDIFPDRKSTEKYRARYNYIYHDKCATLKTSFGCPYNCKFCFCTRVCGYAVRKLDRVMDELQAVEEENVFIVDDDFTASDARVREFCKLLDERNIRKHFIAFSRADFVTVHPETVRLMAKHGFDAFFIGIESFRVSELDRFDKRTTVEQNSAAVRVLEDAGMQCYSGLIVGEDWKREDFNALINYLNGFDHPLVNIQPITPMPGTPLYDSYDGEITVPREKYHLWDMAHVVFKPKYLSRRSYYRNILRAYLKTSANKKQRKYIREKYGKRIYRRVKRGAAHIFMQYLGQIIKPS